MELQKTGPGFLFSTSGNKNKAPARESAHDHDNAGDLVSIGRGNSSVDIDVINPGLHKSISSTSSTLVRPRPDVKTARNNAPVVIVHGTLREKDSIADYLHAALESGHPTDLSTCLSIKEGKEIQKSGQLVSRRINNSRMELARENVETIKSFNGDQEKIKKFFLMEDDLYGKAETGVDQITGLIPGVAGKMDEILNLDGHELADSFSLRTSQVEEQLAKQVEKTDFARDMNPKQRGKVCKKVAEEIMDTIAPRAILVGHSMGGFVNHIVALNPQKEISDGNPFTYDGGNGISTVMHLSAPVGGGVTSPLPKGLANFYYDMAERHFFDPLEQTPGMQLAMMNPFFTMWYAAGKEMTRQNYKTASKAGASFVTPAIHAQKPGYGQISEGSDFIKTYLDSRQIPPGVTFITVTSKDDGVSEQDRSVLCESNPNVHNLDVDVEITPKDLQEKYSNTKSRVTHFKMANFPTEHWNEFQEKVVHCPRELPRLLNSINYDGMRWNALKALKDTADVNPQLFREPGFAQAMDSIRDVAAERLPFKDSPSYVAKQLLDVLDGRIEPDPPKTTPDVWILSEPAGSGQY